VASLTERIGWAEGETIHLPPRFSLGGRSIILGPYDSAESHDKHFSETYGSGDPILDSTDELRFSQKTSRLVSCRLGVPENPTAGLRFITRAGRLPCRDALPCLPPDTSFQLVAAKHTEIDDRGAALAICRSSDDDQLVARVRIGMDLEMLLGPQEIAGFILRNPARYLAYGWKEVSALDQAGDLSILLARCVRLLDADFVARLDDADPGAGQALDDLLTAGRKLAASAQRDALLRALEDVVDTFYPDRAGS